MTQPVKSHRRTSAPTLGWLLLCGAVAAGAAWWFWPVADPEVIWARAEADFQAGQWEKAGRGLERLRTIREPNSMDIMLQAQLAMAHDQMDEALSLMDSVPDDATIATQARLAAGQLELRRHRLRPAERYFNAALELDPGLIQARRELVYILGMQLRRDELCRQFEILAKQVPLSYSDVFLWSIARGNDWEQTEHEAILTQFLAADPEDRPTRMALAVSLADANKLTEAERVLEPLLDEDNQVRKLRADIALARGDLDAVERLLSGAGAEAPELAQMRGKLALSRRDPETAIAAFKLVEAADPLNRDAMFGLSRAYQLAGDTAAAAPYMEASRRLDNLSGLISKAGARTSRSDPELMKRLGHAYQELGRAPEARAWFTLAIEQDPLDTEAQQALFRLQMSESTASSSDAARQSAATPTASAAD